MARSQETHVAPGAEAFPVGAHDARLLSNVHPADWTNPVAGDRYHLVVVGAGTGGLVTAAIAVALGARVALVERHLMGGDCLNVGCVPSKAVLRAARGWTAAREAAERFGGPAVAGEGDFAAAMERMRRIRADISGHDGARRFSELGVDVFLGQAVFAGPDSVRVGDQTLRFRRAVVATGTRPAVPPIPGLEGSGYLTNETAFSLTERPARLVVIGGGPIGCELAQAFARFGSRVTLVEAGDRVLANDDAEAAAVVAGALERDGIRLLCGARVEEVRGGGGTGETTVRIAAGGATEEIVCDRLLVATGRTPNVEGLGLQAAQVRFDERSGIEVDERLRTTNSRVYAIGDVASALRFTHVADAHARMVVRNALFYGRGSTADLVIPWVTYTEPELAHVGPSTREIQERAAEIETVTVPVAEVDRARLDGETEGFLRVHLEKGTDTIVAATVVGEHAGELIAPLTQAITHGIGLGKLGEAVFPYPTRAEIVRRAADAWRRRKLTPLARSAFGAFFRMVR